MYLAVYTDGGARGNPGNAGLGVYIQDKDGNPVEKRYKNLGETTNNRAEYLGAYFGIQRAIELGAQTIDLYMDSKLVIEQLLGNWKVKDAELRKIYDDIQKILLDNPVVISYNWIAREKNKEADRLSNRAMDEKK